MRAVIKIDTLENINTKNGIDSINNENIDLKIYTDNDKITNIYDDFNAFEVLNTKFEKVFLNDDKGFIYVIGTSRSIYNMYAHVSNKLIQKSFNDLDILQNVYEVLDTNYSELIQDKGKDDFIKRLNQITKFYTEDNGKGERDEEYMISINELFEQYGIIILRYEYKNNDGHYEIKKG